MRSETRGNGKVITRQKPVSAPKKRGRPKKVQPPVIEQMKADSEFAPQIKFLRDLAVNDVTEVLEGADPGFVYRWCEESKIPLRESQGYATVGESEVKTHFPSNFMPPAGFETRQTNRGGMKLMKIPRKLKEYRDKMKDEKVDEQMQAFDSQMARNISDSGYEALPDSDKIVQETLAGR